MSTIYTRAIKGSALTWTEGDANITNLNNDKIQSVVEDLTPQLGGDLDVNGRAIVSAINGNIRVEPNGSGNIALTPTTGKIVLGALDFPTGMGSNGQVLTTNGSSAMTWSTPSSGGIANVVEDISPQLGGDLDVNGRAIVSAINGNIRIEPNGSGNIALTPTTGKIILGALDFPTGMGTNGQVLTTNGSSAMTWSTVSGGISDVVSDTTPQLGGNLDVNGQQIVSASNGNIVIAPNGTGKTQVSAINYNEGAINDLGTTGGTITPNVANGNVQKITLNSALTLNAFASPVAGQSLTLIIYGGTAYTGITSTMKFAGGIKTLTGTAGCIDIVSIYYDGTTYFASLGKGFA